MALPGREKPLTVTIKASPEATPFSIQPPGGHIVPQLLCWGLDPKPVLTEGAGLQHRASPCPTPAAGAERTPTRARHGALHPCPAQRQRMSLCSGSSSAQQEAFRHSAERAGCSPGTPGQLTRPPGSTKLVAGSPSSKLCGLWPRPFVPLARDCAFPRPDRCLRQDGCRFQLQA